jgi:hypothetical protein
MLLLHPVAAMGILDQHPQGRRGREVTPAGLTLEGKR